MFLSMVVKTVSINFSRTNIRNFQKPSRLCVVNNIAARLNRMFLFSDMPSFGGIGARGVVEFGDFRHF